MKIALTRLILKFHNTILNESQIPLEHKRFSSNLLINEIDFEKKLWRRQKLFPNKEFSSSLIDFNDFDVAALEGL